MPALKWQTFATGRTYHAETLIGVSIHVAMRRERGKDKGFILSIGPQSFTTSIRSPERAMRRAEQMYCDVIRQEWERVCC